MTIDDLSKTLRFVIDHECTTTFSARRCKVEPRPWQRHYAVDLNTASVKAETARGFKMPAAALNPGEWTQLLHAIADWTARAEFAISIYRTEA